MQNSNERGRRGRAKGTPGYLRHRDRKRGDRAFVLLDGKRVYLGQWNSPESRTAYDREIAAWLARGRAAPAKAETKVEGRKVVEIIEAFWKHAQEHYRHEDGTPTGETDRIIQYALRPVRLLFADQPAKEFGPACLEAVRNHMIEEGLARSVINQRIGVVKRMFRWAERKLG